MIGRGSCRGATIGVPWFSAVPRWLPLYLARIGTARGWRLDAAVQVESGEGLRLAQGVQCRLGGGAGLEELIYARGGQCPIYDVVGGDQTQADVGFAGAACDVNEGRHGVRF
jgi:hypothetical protein